MWRALTFGMLSAVCSNLSSGLNLPPKMPREREAGRLSVRSGLTDRKVQAEELITEASEKIHHVKTEILNSGPLPSQHQTSLCFHCGEGA